MDRDLPVRITAVANGFVVDAVPHSTQFGRKRYDESIGDVVCGDVHAFETIESLLGWLQEHFTYRPDSKADRWTEEEIAEIRKQGPGPITINRIDSE